MSNKKSKIKHYENPQVTAKWVKFEGKKKCQTCGKPATLTLKFVNSVNNLFKCETC